METTTQQDSSRLPTEKDSKSTVGITTMAGKEYVIVFYLCHGTDLILFTDTV